MKIYNKFICSTLFLFISTVLLAQSGAGTYQLNGKVSSKENQPIENVRISVINSSKTGLTDESGNFTIQVENGDILVFEANGYKKNRVEIEGQQNVQILLEESLNVNDEQIAAFGSHSKRELVGSVDGIGQNVIRRNNVMRVEEALNGTISGLYSLKSDGEKYAATNYNLYVRGKATTANSRPLILVDGVDANINLIDPSEIESVTVLKDASELAMYGMRGANGVILITTKEGNSGESFIHLDIREGVQTPVKIAPKLDAFQYTTLHNEAMLNDGATPIYDPEVYTSDHNEYLYPDTDMPGNFLKDNSTYQQYNFTTGGGNETARYFALLGYAKQDGLFKQAASGFNINQFQNERFNFRTNFNIDLGRGFTFNSKLQAIYDKLYSPWIRGQWCNAIASSVFNTIMNTRANAYPLFNPDGSLGGTSEFLNNPVGLLDNGSRVEESRQLTAQVSLAKDLDFITSGLSLSMMYNFSNFNSYYKGKYKSFAVYQMVSDSTYTQYGVDDSKVNTPGGSLSNYFNDHYFQAGLNYVHDFGAHAFNASLIFNRYSSNVSGDTPPYVWLGTSVRLLYSYLQKYYAQFSGAYQGSNNYASGNRYGLFPSFGLGWVISEEDFMSSLASINYLKLKASFGAVGNDQTGGSRFKYQQNYYLGEGYGFGIPNGEKTGSYEGTLPDIGDTWETSYMGNVGLELAAFKNTLNVEAAYFFEERTDILVPQSNQVSSVIGIGLPYVNGGTIRNQGVELSAVYKNRVGELQFSFGGNLLYARNEIVDLKEKAYPYDWQYRKGHSINTVFGYQAEGLLSETDLENAASSSFGLLHAGDIKYVNQNSEDDNIINELDAVALGSNFPEMIYGFHLELTFKNFDFYAYGEGSSLFNNYNRPAMFSEYAYNNRYQGDVNALYPNLTLVGMHNSQTSTFWEQKGNMLRITSLELGYTISRKICEKLHLEKLRIYANAHNPFSFMKEREGRDLEATSAGFTTYPLLKTWMMGLKISL